MKLRLFILLPFLFLLLGASDAPKPTDNPGVDELAKIWVDSVFNSLTPTERIGQLFMIRAHSDLGADHIQSVKNDT